MTATAQSGRRTVALPFPFPPRTRNGIHKMWRFFEHKRIHSYNGTPACSLCDAYDMWTYEAPGGWHGTTYHDEWCPLWTHIRRE